jgi:hypothetical protein
MDFNISGEEEALLLHLREVLRDGLMPTEADLADELGDEVREQVRSLARRGWLILQSADVSDTAYVEGLTPWAETALSSRRDVGGS